MRGDPEFDNEINSLYKEERNLKQRKLKVARIFVALCGVLAILILFTANYRPTRAAMIPFVIGLGILQIFDSNWRSLNRNFTYWYVATCGGIYLAWLFLLAL